MPLGIISEEEFLNELAPPKELPKVVHIERGRGSVKEVPQSIRAFIAGESLNGARAQELSEAFNISESSISAYKNGATSTASYNKPDENLKANVDSIKEQISDRAQKKLRIALNALTKDKMQESSARELSGVAKDMAVIVEKMTPKTSNDDVQVVLHLHGPKMKRVEDYEVIDV